MRVEPISMRAMERARLEHAGRAAAVTTDAGPMPAVTCSCGWRTLAAGIGRAPIPPHDAGAGSAWDRHRRHVAAAARRLDMIMVQASHDHDQ